MISRRAIKYSTALLVLAAGRSWLLKQRRTDLIFNGRIRALETVLIALISRMVTMPLMRLIRWLCRIIVLPVLGRMPLQVAEPLFLHQLHDSAGRYFLTRVLQDSGVLQPGSYVRRTLVVPFSAGQMSSSARVELTYGDRDASSSFPNANPGKSWAGLNKNTSTRHNRGPPSLIVKMTRQDIVGKTVNMLVGCYRECQIYRELLPATDLPVPQCYYSSVSNLSSDFFLVLSDGAYLGPVHGKVKAYTLGSISIRSELDIPDAIVAPGYLPEVFDATPSPDIPESYLAVERVHEMVHMMKRACVLLSKMHARFWGDYSLFTRDLSLSNRDALSEAFAMMVDSWEKTKQKARSGKYEGKCGPWRGLPESEWESFESMVEDTLMYPNIKWGLETFGEESGWRRQGEDTYRWNIIADAGFTLIHGDFHSENVFIRNISGYHKREHKDSASEKGSNKSEENHAKHAPGSGDDSIPEFLILDWQLPEVGDPVKDVARMMMMGGLDNYHRNIHEKAIVKAWWEALIENGVPESDYPWELAWASYRWFCGWQAALVLMACHASKWFEEHDGAGYRTAVDKFKAVVHFHGDPRKIFEERYEILKKIEKVWRPAPGSREANIIEGNKRGRSGAE